MKTSLVFVLVLLDAFEGLGGGGEETPGSILRLLSFWVVQENISLFFFFMLRSLGLRKMLPALPPATAPRPLPWEATARGTSIALVIFVTWLFPSPGAAI